MFISTHTHTWCLIGVVPAPPVCSKLCWSGLLPHAVAIISDMYMYECVYFTTTGNKCMDKATCLSKERTVRCWCTVCAYLGVAQNEGGSWVGNKGTLDSNSASLDLNALFRNLRNGHTLVLTVKVGCIHLLLCAASRMWVRHRSLVIVGCFSSID